MDLVVPGHRNHRNDSFTFVVFIQMIKKKNEDDKVLIYLICTVVKNSFLRMFVVLLEK